MRTKGAHERPPQPQNGIFAGQRLACVLSAGRIEPGASKMACVTQLIIRLAKPEDVEAMLHLERQAGTAAHWSRAQYEAIFQPDAPSRLCLLAESGGVQGFLVAQTAGPEWELENVVVAATARRQGLGKQLVGELLRRARQQGAAAILLEVRASNAAALALYLGCGFARSGSRPRYYQDPPEDAIICRKSLKETC